MEIMEKEEKKKVLRSLWHSSTESPGRKYVYVLSKVKGHKTMLCELMRFLTDGVTPATVVSKMKDGTPKLAVAWAYADELTSTITESMIEQAKIAAWSWYKEDGKEDEED